MSTALEPRVSNLELSLKELAYAQLRTERSLEELSNELKDFKNEMKDFKDEMKDFKDESRRQSREMNKRWGELANRLGTVIEDIVAPNIPGIMARHFGVDEPDLLMVRPRKKHPQDPGRRREFDVVAVAGNRVFLNETKSRLREQDVLVFAGNYQEVTDYFPEYSGYEIIPIMSSLYLTPDQVELLTRHGIYALAMSDDSMDLLNLRELAR
ncbi:hypothetical protein AU468_04225 [Alkalispirochaeta sphaeroplastigenens]|uniref:DUF8196 domain-containing protein n=1 Tax=Alkalispirochaeta sphaeroplastigenens TaxID=1187066 RepID=A0A2S4JWX9_9SPIO|nr:hypothetical protein [Alkalispirochaeta sphaeroplastigenens]POR04028.1 hypothetical protein AU468_04225 [Alkalispirochaeta sphaeroplastigenens]